MADDSSQEAYGSMIAHRPVFLKKHLSKMWLCMKLHLKHNLFLDSSALFTWAHYIFCKGMKGVTSFASSPLVNGRCRAKCTAIGGFSIG